MKSKINVWPFGLLAVYKMPVVTISPIRLDSGRVIVSMVKFLANHIDRIKSESRAVREMTVFQMNELFNASC